MKAIKSEDIRRVIEAHEAWQGWFSMPLIRASLPGLSSRRRGADAPIDAAVCHRRLEGVRAPPGTRASSETALLYAKSADRLQYSFGVFAVVAKTTVSALSAVWNKCP